MEDPLLKGRVEQRSNHPVVRRRLLHRFGNKKIAAAEAELAFLMRWDKSNRTGKPYGEIYAISFAASMREQIIAAMEDFTPDLSIPARAGWHLLHRLRDVATMVEIDDETEDFDNPKDYERWMVATGRRG